MHYGGASMPTPPEKKDRQPTSSPDDLEGDAALAGDGTLRTPSRLAKIYNQYTYTPERCRYRPESPSKLTTWLNVLFAFAGCFTVANLYYSQPILNRLADEFNISFEQSSRIPTLAQAGYACGMAFICPLGDVVKRRPFTLYLIWMTATIWIGLCITDSFAVFCTLSFLTGLTTVTPQIMLPLIGDLAPPHRRAQALSLVVSGLVLGILIARLLSGIVTEYTGWRTIYWISFALQYLILLGLYLSMPDYPATNRPKSIIREYPRLLYSILRLALTTPLIIQVCLIGYFTSAIFMSFWTTLTFLLASPPYNFSTLVIGLFALIGIGSMAWGPFFSRLVIDRFVPLFSTIIGELVVLVAVAVGTYAGLHTIAAPVLEALLLDIGMQTAQIANRSNIYSVAPLARNRVNTCYMVMTFAGQLTGTAAGNHLYARGGWILSGSANIGFVGAALVFCAVRGPHEKRWVGWSGGWHLRKDVPRKEGKVSGSAEEAADRDPGRGNERKTEDTTHRVADAAAEKEIGEKAGTGTDGSEMFHAASGAEAGAEALALALAPASAEDQTQTHATWKEVAALSSSSEAKEVKVSSRNTQQHTRYPKLPPRPLPSTHTPHARTHIANT